MKIPFVENYIKEKLYKELMLIFISIDPIPIDKIEIRLLGLLFKFFMVLKKILKGILSVFSLPLIGILLFLYSYFLNPPHFLVIGFAVLLFFLFDKLKTFLLEETLDGWELFIKTLYLLWIDYRIQHKLVEATPKDASLFFSTKAIYMTQTSPLKLSNSEIILEHLNSKKFISHLKQELTDLPISEEKKETLPHFYETSSHYEEIKESFIAIINAMEYNKKNDKL